MRLPFRRFAFATSAACLVALASGAAAQDRSLALLPIEGRGVDALESALRTALENEGATLASADRTADALAANDVSLDDLARAPQLAARLGVRALIVLRARRQGRGFRLELRIVDARGEVTATEDRRLRRVNRAAARALARRILEAATPEPDSASASAPAPTREPEPSALPVASAEPSFTEASPEPVRDARFWFASEAEFGLWSRTAEVTTRDGLLRDHVVPVFPTAGLRIELRPFDPWIDPRLRGAFVRGRFAHSFVFGANDPNGQSIGGSMLLAEADVGWRIELDLVRIGASVGVGYSELVLDDTVYFASATYLRVRPALLLEIPVIAAEMLALAAELGYVRTTSGGALAARHGPEGFYGDGVDVRLVARGAVPLDRALALRWRVEGLYQRSGLRFGADSAPQVEDRADDGLEVAFGLLFGIGVELR